MSSRPAILYVGGFVLPDGNAAAQRVLANAKLFSEVGFDVIFLNYSPDADVPKKVSYQGFDCFECPAAEWGVASRMDIDRIKEIVSLRPEIGCIVAYNYPSPSLSKLLGFCKKAGIKCVGDITEWYRARDVSLAKRPFKYFDTALRMRFLNKRCDGLIVISRFLEGFYRGSVSTLYLPPLVDSSDVKWSCVDKPHDGLTRFIYAGRPSRTKERLDLIADAVAGLSGDLNVTLDIVGVTREECGAMYNREFPGNPRIEFHGRIPHEEALGYVLRADYSFVIRDDNRVTKAGFPTKFAESVTCGTSVICNDNSDLRYWVNRTGCGSLVTEENLLVKLEEIVRGDVSIFDRRTFDYRNFFEQAEGFFGALFEEKGLL